MLLTRSHVLVSSPSLLPWAVAPISSLHPWTSLHNAAQHVSSALSLHPPALPMVSSNSHFPVAHVLLHLPPPGIRIVKIWAPSSTSHLSFQPPFPITAPYHQFQFQSLNLLTVTPPPTICREPLSSLSWISPITSSRSLSRSSVLALLQLIVHGGTWNDLPEAQIR